MSFEEKTEMCCILLTTFRITRRRGEGVEKYIDDIANNDSMEIC